MRFKAKLKPWSQVIEDSKHVDISSGSGSYEVWHPKGKFINVQKNDLKFFNQECEVSVRDTYKGKKVYNIYFREKQLVGYDYWFEYIDDGDRSRAHLESELFEI